MCTVCSFKSMKLVYFNLFKNVPQRTLLSRNYFNSGRVLNKIKIQRNYSIKCFSSISSIPKDEVFKPSHIPVLASEVIECLSVKENGVYLDLTFGAGGHTQMLLESAPNLVVYSLDRDPVTEQFSKRLQKEYPNKFYPMLGKFSDLPTVLRQHGVGINYFNGILMDLGVSSMQFDTPERGFMLSKDGPLDMRMDRGRAEGQPTAADILEHIDEISLYRVLKYYGQEKKARKLSQALIESRMLFKRLRTTKELAEFVLSVSGVEMSTDKLQRFSHPATKTFQALRILVNDELNELDYGIQLAHRYLQPDGILAAISFHSLEDTIIKRHFTGCDLDITPDSIGMGLYKHRRSYLASYTSEELSKQVSKPWTPLHKHVMLPSEEEIQQNPRARSAKLRAASKSHIYSY